MILPSFVSSPSPLVQLIGVMASPPMVVPVTVSFAPAISPTPSVRLTLETFTVVVLYSSTITTVLASSTLVEVPPETILTMALPSEFIVTMNVMGLEDRYPSGALISVSVYVPFFSGTECGVPLEVHSIGLNFWPLESTSPFAVNRSFAPAISLPPTSRLEMSTSPEVGVWVFVTV